MSPHGKQLPESADQAREALHMTELFDTLRRLQSRIPDMPCRVVPSSFDPDDEDLMAFPLPLSFAWTSCERALVRAHPRGVMMRLPLFWQLEAPLHAVCRAAGAPIFINDRANMPVGAAAIQLADMDTVVTTADDAVKFSEFLAEKHAPQPNVWFVIHSLEEYAQRTEPLRLQGGHIIEEVHVFPGVVLLEQCGDCPEHTGFHVSDAFRFELRENDTLITTKEDSLVPFARLALPIALREQGLCPCGKRTVARADA